MQLEAEGGPLFNNAWREVVFVHYEADPETLRAQVPFKLDHRAGRAYVSLVAFTMSELRPFRRHRAWQIALAPMRTLRFLNLRTYVRHQGESGVYFLAEWLPRRLPVFCGRHTFGLPYRFGRLSYHGSIHGFSGCVREGLSGPCLSFDVKPTSVSAPRRADSASLDEFLIERYSAFTQWGGVRRRFRIWHEPWAASPVDFHCGCDDLLRNTGDWHRAARFSHAAYSPGLDEIWIGRPRRLVSVAEEG
jgi:uncharacterized protein YqjF (DUF2071 family)